MTDYDVEKKAEELLQAIGKELAKSRAKYADDILSGKDIPLYAKSVQKKWPARKKLKRTMILVAVLIMMMGLFITSVTGVSERIFNYFAEKGSALPIWNRILQENCRILNLPICRKVTAFHRKTTRNQ